MGMPHGGLGCSKRPQYHGSQFEVHLARKAAFHMGSRGLSAAFTKAPLRRLGLLVAHPPRGAIHIVVRY